jgi:D-alanine-D-alanine ligase
VKTVVIYDRGAESWAPEDVQAVLDSVESVSEVLAAAGQKVTRVPVDTDLAWFDAVRRADLVFNLCEGVGGVSRLEYPVASAIELAGVPCTGTSAWTMTVCHRKPVLNAVLQSHGLPVPRWTVPVVGDESEDFLLPAIVKPAAEDASIGIEQSSVVATPEMLAERVRQLRARHGQVMVQEYVPGREFNVGFVGQRALPVSEIDFSAMPSGAWPIVSFAAKWHDHSAEYAGTKPVCPADIDAHLAARLVETAREAWRAVEGQGYGRVDLRLDTDGQPWVLEVNPNPDLSKDAGLANMARAFGWSYADLVRAIVDAALDRPAAARPSHPQKVSAA